MILSIWRYTHLSLAIFASLFLVMASLSGAILAYDAVQEKYPSYKSADFDKITLAELLPQVKSKYEDVSELEIDHNAYVSIRAIDVEGNDIEGIINPKTAEIVAKPIVKSAFIQWVTAFHRSMFLKETGRLIIGIVSFLLIIIAVSGLFLVIQRQQKLVRFFSKIIKEYFTQYFHVISGRLMLIPILLIAITGTYLSMARFDFFGKNKTQRINYQVNDDEIWQMKLTEIPLFNEIKLNQVKKIEFPFGEEHDEYYIIKLKDKELTVNQYNGDVISELRYQSTTILEELSLDWHTGRSNILLAVILGLASLSILFFIYSGFSITLRRGKTKIKNKYKADEAEFVFLVGSEGGSTLHFANNIHQQLLALGKRSFIAQLNEYQLYPKAEHLIIFTSTYGLGDAPSNADKTLRLIEKTPQQHWLNFCVVGFGSTDYDDYCQFAKEVSYLLAKKDWAIPFMPMFKINDKSSDEFVEWVKMWMNKVNLELSTTAAVYQNKPKDLQKLMVLERTELNEEEHSFKMVLHSPARTKFTSGDLLAIYPNNDGRERLYSIAKCNGQIQLLVKHYPNGLGSGFLNNLKVGDTLNARLITNKKFHYPKGRKIIMIGNGTGIAPFLGMIDQSNHDSENYLYLGFKKDSSLVALHKSCLDTFIKVNKLKQYQVAFSREQNNCYVMDLIKQDGAIIMQLLRDGAIIMLCGSLAMQSDVESTINQLCLDNDNYDFNYYKKLGRILIDCY